MPLYEYFCDDCDELFEIIRSVADEDEVTCPKCEAKARKMISGFFSVRSSGSSAATGCGSAGSGGSWSGG